MPPGKLKIKKGPVSKEGAMGSAGDRGPVVSGSGTRVSVSASPCGLGHRDGPRRAHVPGALSMPVLDAGQ